MVIQAVVDEGDGMLTAEKQCDEIYPLAAVTSRIQIRLIPLYFVLSRLPWTCPCSVGSL